MLKRIMTVIRQNIILVCITVLILGGIQWYSHHQFSKGYDQAVLEAQAHAREIEAAYRRQEQTMQVKIEEQNARHLKEITQVLSERNTAKHNSERLRQQINTLNRRAAEMARGSGSDVASAQAPWQVLEECRRRYEAVATEADELNEDFRVVQGWARAISH